MKHRNYLTCKIQCKRNFSILVNWFKVITSQTRLPRILNCLHQHDNNKWPTLRDSKPSQIDSKWIKIWKIGSLVWTLNTPKVTIHETLLGVRYSIANIASYRCLTLRQKCRFDNCSKQDFMKWLVMEIYYHGTHRCTKLKVLEALNTS